MSTRKRISQREAMRMRKELKSLRYLKDRLSSDWVGMRMRFDSVHAETREAVRVARILGFVVIAVPASDGRIELRVINPNNPS